MNKRLSKKIEKIAKRHFCVTTLERRNRDSLDFYNVAVWSMQDALMEAFTLGAETAKANSECLKQGREKS